MSQSQHSRLRRGVLEPVYASPVRFPVLSSFFLVFPRFSWGNLGFQFIFSVIVRDLNWSANIRQEFKRL